MRIRNKLVVAAIVAVLSSFSQSSDLRSLIGATRFQGKRGLNANRAPKSKTRPRRASSLTPPGRTTISKIESAGNAPIVVPGIGLRPSLATGPSPSSVAVGDFNRDGHMDFVVANGISDDLWLYLGKGDGSFEPPRIIPLTQGVSPVQLEVYDLRKNGILDLIVANIDTDSIGVLLGNGDGTFGNENYYQLPAHPEAITVSDFNRDGFADVVAVMSDADSNNGDYISTLLGDGTGKLAAPVITQWTEYSSYPWHVDSGDLNGDGLPDLMISGPNPDFATVYLNAGDAHFNRGQVLFTDFGGVFYATDARLGDVNEDGCLDVVVAGARTSATVHFGDCTGNFTAGNWFRMGDSPSAERLVDINGDGHLDVVASTLHEALPYYGGGTISVAYGDGKGNFTNGRIFRGSGEAYALAIADFNEDGHPDVVTADTASDSSTVYVNDGKGTFGFPQGVTLSSGAGAMNRSSSQASVVDVNNDGKTDVVLLTLGPALNTHYCITSLLNDGTGVLADPLFSDTGIDVLTQGVGDYRLADFRNTGRMDFLAVGQSIAYSPGGAQDIIFAPSNGDGTFGATTVQQVQGATGLLAVGDWNHDGKLDFAAVGPSGVDISKRLTPFLGNGDGTFTRGTPVAFNDSGNDVARVAAGDFNHDGKLDILVFTTGNGYWTSASNLLEFLGKGDGSFSSPITLFSPFAPMNVVDLNGDHSPDLMQYPFMWPGNDETVGPTELTSYLGQPDGTFKKTADYTPYSGVPLSLQPYLQQGELAGSSFTPDLNGDGMADAIAFQRVSSVDADAYAQILVGNGDGTFTPTYNIYDFHRDVTWPAYAKDMDGDGWADLVEVDSGVGSIDVFKTVPAPALQIELEDKPLNTNRGCGSVFPNLPPSSDTVVTLSSGVPGVNLPSTVTIPAGARSQRFCYTLDSNYDWHRVFDVRATLGSDVAVAYASRAYIVGFDAFISPATDQLVYSGQSSAPVEVVVTPVTGYSSTVTLSCNGLFAGQNCTFTPSTLNLNRKDAVSSTVVVSAPSDPLLSGGPVQIIASDGAVTKRPVLTVQYTQLTMSTPSAATAPPGGSATAGVTVYGIPPFSLSCSGLPASASCSFADLSDFSNSSAYSITVNVGAGTASGNYPFTVVVTSHGTQTSAAANLKVVPAPDFTVDTSTPLWVLPGSTLARTVKVTPLNGNAQIISFSCTTDWGGTCTASDIQTSGPGTVTLNITVPQQTAVGQHKVTLSGTTSNATHQFDLVTYVADYRGSASVTSLSVVRGGEATATVSLTADSGFADDVVLSCDASQISCAFAPSSTVHLVGGTPSTVTVTLTASPTASNRPPRLGGLLTELALLLGLPIGACWVSLQRERKLKRVLFAISAISAVLFLITCGGGGTSTSSSGGDHGSSTYAVKVNVSAPDTSTTHSVATISITVNH